MSTQTLRRETLSVNGANFASTLERRSRDSEELLAYLTKSFTVLNGRNRLYSGRSAILSPESLYNLLGNFGIELEKYVWPNVRVDNQGAITLIWIFGDERVSIDASSSYLTFQVWNTAALLADARENTTKMSDVLSGLGMREDLTRTVTHKLETFTRQAHPQWKAHMNGLF